jgi:hypothetical protein
LPHKKVFIIIINLNYLDIDWKTFEEECKNIVNEISNRFIDLGLEDHETDYGADQLQVKQERFKQEFTRLPFVFDATATLADRILRRRRFWEGHREHVYQRLSLLGFGHLKTALVYYALMASSAAAALAGLAGTDGADDGRRWAPAVAMARAFGALYLRVRQLWHRRQATGQGV